ncbi:MAG: hypothetical protein ACWIPH_08200 [Ostreibacterium sp.]
MDQTTHTPSDDMLPQGFKTVIGVLLLLISIGCMSLLGIFA